MRSRRVPGYQLVGMAAWFNDSTHAEAGQTREANGVDDQSRGNNNGERTHDGFEAFSVRVLLPISFDGFADIPHKQYQRSRMH